MHSLVVLVEGIGLDRHVVVLVEALAGPVVRVLPVRVVLVEATLERDVLTLPGVHGLIGGATAREQGQHGQRYHHRSGCCEWEEEEGKENDYYHEEAAALERCC